MTAMSAKVDENNRVLSASLFGVSGVRRYLRPEATTPTRFLS